MATLLPPTVVNVSAKGQAELRRLATIAAIPPENVDAFQQEVIGHLLAYHCMREAADLLDQRKLAIKEFVTASDRMLRAISLIQKYEKSEIAETDDGTADQLFSRYFRLEQISWEPRQPSELSLADIKYVLADLHETAKKLSNAVLPKVRNNPTNVFLKNVWAAAHKHDGKLTYFKNAEPPSGTFTEVMALYRKMKGWREPSPTTIDDHLRP